MDALSETLRSHEKRIKTLQNFLRVIPKVKSRYEKELDVLQEQASIMAQEIRSGKSLS